MRKICIIGTGYVGLVTGSCYAHLGHKVICVDNNADKIRILKAGGVPIYEPGLEKLVKENVKAKRISFSTDIAYGVKNSEIILIAVSTPPKIDGKVDLSFVEKVARQVAEVMDSYKVIVDKSTVPVQTGEKVAETIKRYNKHKIDFDIASLPEFLREGTAISDFLNPDRIVIGVSSSRAEKILKEIHEKIKAPVIVTDIKSAELIKHAANSFLATKISFANALANICELSGADISLVTKGMGMDKRIGEQYLRAGLGYGGSCFPKDVAGFIQIAKELGYDFNLLREVERINRQQRKIFLKKIEDTLWVLKEKTVGILGLAFKPNTDDMRNAPSIDIIQNLIKEGAKIKAYDPVAEKKAKEILGDSKITYCKDPYEVAKGSEALVIVTEWDEFKKLDLERIAKLLIHPIIIDGRNIFDPKKMEKLGFVYKSVGR